MKSTPTRGVKQYLKPGAYKQSELDWTLMTTKDGAGPWNRERPHGGRNIRGTPPTTGRREAGQNSPAIRAPHQTGQGPARSDAALRAAFPHKVVISVQSSDGVPFV